MRVITAAAIGAALLVAAPHAARANPEAGFYDSRSVGMAGSGVALIDTPSAVFHNPANLVAGTETYAATIALTGLIVDLSAPVEGPDDNTHTGPSFAPIGLVSGALRVHDRVVVGLGAYISTGYGGDYNGVERLNETDLFYPQDQSASLFVTEMAAPVSVRLSDRIDLGVALRVPFARLRAEVTQEILTDDWKPVTQSARGVGTPGVLIGVTYRPSTKVSLGLVYRSKVQIDLQGTTAIAFTQADPLKIDVDTQWSVPHMVRAGIAGHFRDRLNLAFEARMQFHDESNNNQIFYADLEKAGLEGFDDLAEIVVPLEWKNVYNFMFGAEVFTKRHHIPVRFGYSMSNSATPRSAAQIFMPPPGLQYAIFAGSGFEAGSFKFDYAFSANTGKDDVPMQAGRCQPGDVVKVGCPGEYSVKAAWITLSVTHGQ